MASLEAQLDELRLEIVAQRLIMRSLVAAMVLRGDPPLREIAAAFERAEIGMSPDLVPIDDLDPVLHQRAAVLATKRSQQLLAQLGSLVLAPDRRARKISAAQQG